MPKPLFLPLQIFRLVQNSTALQTTRTKTPASERDWRLPSPPIVGENCVAVVVVVSKDDDGDDEDEDNDEDAGDDDDEDGDDDEDEGGGGEERRRCSDKNLTTPT